MPAAGAMAFAMRPPLPPKTSSSSSSTPEEPRLRRRLTKRDPLMHLQTGREDEDWSFGRTPRRQFIESGRRCLLHAEFLKSRENMYTATVKIGMAAAKWACENKEEALHKHCVLKAIGDEMNREMGYIVTDAYTEDEVDYSQWLASPDEDPEEEILLPGPRRRNSWDISERPASHEWKKGEASWRQTIKRKDILWMRIHDDTQEFRMM